MFRDHLSSSFFELLGRLLEWVDRLPRWLRPAFFGAALVYAFMIWRGALLVLPLLFVYLFFKDRTFLIAILPVLFLYAPGAGFLGGLAFGLTDPVLQRLGRLGRILAYTLGTWTYCVVLIFFIMPLLDPKEAARSSPGENWVISGIMGVIFGLAIGTNATGDPNPRPAQGHRLFVVFLGVSLLLLITMKVLGWW